jgi:hypothetical protein
VTGGGQCLRTTDHLRYFDHRVHRYELDLRVLHAEHAKDFVRECLSDRSDAREVEHDGLE